MPYSPQLYRNLPLYARMLDEQGLLQHICEALQIGIEIVRDRIASQSRLYDPDLTDDRFLDWLGQVVGAAPVGTQWLGLGLNPDWPAAHKRRVIKRLWTYWQIKGTELGIREAVALWLRWEEAHSDRLIINLPFGKTPTAHPPQWWDWATPYDAHFTQTWPERQRLGSGDYPQTYEPDWIELQAPEWYWEYDEIWSDRTLDQVDAPPITPTSSAMGPEKPWMHFYLNNSDWNNVLPDILELNLEAWSAQAQPVVFGWLDIGIAHTDADGTVTIDGIEPVVLRRSTTKPQTQIIRDIEIDGFQWGDLWPSIAQFTTEPFTITEEEAGFGVWPGAQWGTVWGEEWWYAAWRLIKVQTVLAAIEVAALRIQSNTVDPNASVYGEVSEAFFTLEAHSVDGAASAEIEPATIDVEASDITFVASFEDLDLITVSSPAIAFEANTVEAQAEIATPTTTATFEFAANALTTTASFDASITPATTTISANEVTTTASFDAITKESTLAFNASDVTAQIYDWYLHNVVY